MRQTPSARPSRRTSPWAVVTARKVWPAASRTPKGMPGRGIRRRRRGLGDLDRRDHGQIDESAEIAMRDEAKRAASGKLADDVSAQSLVPERRASFGEAGAKMPQEAGEEDLLGRLGE